MAWDGGAAGPRTRAAAGAIAAAGRRAAVASGDLTARSEKLRQLLSQWALAEVAPGRLLPWLAVAFGCGAVLYLAADTEPKLWAATAAALVGAVLTFSTGIHRILIKGAFTTAEVMVLLLGVRLVFGRKWGNELVTWAFGLIGIVALIAGLIPLVTKGH